MTNLQKFVAWNKERQRRNRVSVLIAAVLVIPIYFVAMRMTSNYEDAEFVSFIVASILGISFGPLISHFLHRHDKK